MSGWEPIREAAAIGALKEVLSALAGFCGGLVISAGVFAFIGAIGIVPRLAHRSGTTKYVKVYEEAIIFGGIFGGATIIHDYAIPIGSWVLAIIGLLYGAFLGSVTVCLAEVLNVMPVMTRRVKLRKGLRAFIISFAMGKLAGALIFFLVPAFG